jgi:Type IV secretion system pilin
MHRKPHYRNAVRRVATIVAITVTALAVAPGPAVAADTTPLAIYDLRTVIDNMTGWITGIIAAVATLFLTIGGARYLMAGGDPSEVERAKGSLKSAGIGYGLALLAPIILGILKSILGAP